MKSMKKVLFAALFAGLMLMCQTGFAQSSKWKSDAGHSNALFAVRHILAPFYGHFNKFEVNLEWNEANPTLSSITATLDPNSVSTGSDGRDEHLKSADFFDAAAHGDWSFKSSKIAAKDKGFVAYGTLTARGKSKEIEVPFEFLGTQDMGKRGMKAGAFSEFTILRSDFGLGEQGPTLADEVKLIISLDLNAN